MPLPYIDIVVRLREKADEIDISVSRNKIDRDEGNWCEIEYMREAANEIERLRKLRPAEEIRESCAAIADAHSPAIAGLIRSAPVSILTK